MLRRYAAPLCCAAAPSCCTVVMLRRHAASSCCTMLHRAPLCCTVMLHRMLHRYAAPLCCTVMLHRYAASVMLHRYAAPLCCTVMLHRYAVAHVPHNWLFFVSGVTEDVGLVDKLEMMPDSCSQLMLTIISCIGIPGNIMVLVVILSSPVMRYKVLICLLCISLSLIC